MKKNRSRRPWNTTPFKNNKFINVIAFKDYAQRFEGLEGQIVIVDGYLNERAKSSEDNQFPEISLIATMVVAIATNPELSDDEVLDQIETPQKSLFDERAERARMLFKNPN